MRVLVACSACQRQFDATGRSPGESFRCSCGSVVTVPAPQGHEAAVVRCSSCGAPREGRQAACSFCGSDFTLHERDLHTLCPACGARVSDRGKYCHSCATPILPQGRAGEPTSHPCPACGGGKELTSRALGPDRLTVFECGSCAGLWLGGDIFNLLESRARQSAGSALDGVRAPASPAAVAAPAQPGPLYRPCAFCGTLMHRRNYGKKSGVIIDVCGEHGIWLDQGELERILSWVRHGGLTRAEKLVTEEAQYAEQARHRAPSQGWGGALFESKSSSQGWSTLDFVELVVDLVGTAFQAFRR